MHSSVCASVCRCSQKVCEWWYFRNSIQESDHICSFGAFGDIDEPTRFLGQKVKVTTWADMVRNALLWSFFYQSIDWPDLDVLWGVLQFWAQWGQDQRSRHCFHTSWKVLEYFLEYFFCDISKSKKSWKWFWSLKVLKLKVLEFAGTWAQWCGCENIPIRKPLVLMICSYSDKTFSICY